MSVWTRSEDALLLDLLTMDTVTPMETGRHSALARAHDRVTTYAVDAGFVVEHRAPPARDTLAGPHVPVTVRERADAMGDGFLRNQPNLVLRMGPRRSPARTIVFNGHLDTVSGTPPVTVDGDVVTGRGAIDAKGPTVAALAGIRAAAAADRALPQRASILVQLVGGEEGGAMGVYGTRELVARRFTGRLNIVVEPTRLEFFDTATASMTASIRVEGEGATDDAPDCGENATLILSFVACHLVEQVGPEAERRHAKLCVAGIKTGTMHNRVFGTGELLVNVAYRGSADGAALQREVELAFESSVGAFRRCFADLAITRRSASRMADVVACAG